MPISPVHLSTSQQEPNPSSRSSSSSSSKHVDQIAIKSGLKTGPSDTTNQFTFIAAGKAKEVFTKVNEESYVYYIPVKRCLKSFFKSKEKEIKEEVTKLTEISNNFRTLKGQEPVNIVKPYIEVEKSERINNKYTVQVDKAQSDGEKFIRN